MKSLSDRLGRPLRSLRISVTDRCNFRCFYCMPPEQDFEFLPREELLSYEEIERLVRIFARLGVKKVRITGGEPLVRKNIEALIERISRIEGISDIALTTNGYRLEEKAPALRIAGLRRITVSLNTLDPAKFSMMAGTSVSIGRVISGIEKAISEGFAQIKINAVVVRGVNDDGILDLAEFCRERRLTLRFIEFMDVGTLNGWTIDKVFSADEILSVMRERYEFDEVGRGKGQTALRFRYRDMDLEFGIIASITRPFCSDCSRIRLSADGMLYTCLFSSEGFNIKRYLRGGFEDGHIARVIERVWRGREDRYSELRLEKISSSRDSTNRVEMFRIGG